MTATPVAQSPTVEARGLSLSHGRAPVIEGLDLPLSPGEVTVIVGPNGCGKSTLLAGLARLHAPREGCVLLDGRDIQRLPPRELARRLALLPQEASAPEGMSVRDLIGFGRQPHQAWWRQWSAQDHQACEQALAAAGLAGLAERPLETLSGGQRQRAWIAMTIAQQTPLVLLDEPTSALDLGHQLEIFELVRELAAAGRTLVLVLHDLASACRYADQLVAMRDGCIIARGAPAEVVTTDLVRELYGVTCTLLHDPATGAPILTDLRRVAAPSST